MRGLRSRLNRRGVPFEYKALAQSLYMGVDILLIVATGYLAYDLRFATLLMPAHYRSVVVLGVLAALIIFPQLRLYSDWTDQSRIQQVQGLLGGWIGVALSLLVLGVLLKENESFSRLWFGLWFVMGGIGLVLGRTLVRRLIRLFRANGNTQCRVVVVGAGDMAQRVVRRAQDSGSEHYRICRVVPAAAQASNWNSARSGVPTLSRHVSLAGFIDRAAIDEVWFCLPLKDEQKLREVQYQLRHTMVVQRFIPDTEGFRLLRHGFTQVVGLPALSLNDTPMRGLNRVLKAIEDRGLAALILLLISPLLLVISIAIKIDSRGPVFYIQERVGWNGRNFRMLKFRSMPVGIEASSGPVWARKSGNRATRLGSFLRRTSLDELPQFINVLTGSMSIVGPRPERPEFIHRFKEEIPLYMHKHMVKAGITGYAQINGWRGDTDLRKRIEYDLYYIEHWSLLLDAKIIFFTVIHGFLNPNAY